MFKRNIFKILAVVFFLLAGTSLYNSNKDKKIQPIKLIQPFDSAQGKPSKPIKIFLTNSVRLNPISSDSIQFYPSPTLIPPTPTISTNSTDLTDLTNSPTSLPPTSAPQNLMILLNINGSSVGSMNVTDGSNQCDVLSQALSQGKIQSLNMRYNNDMGTNAVYQINGVGKENAVWWIFKVNGQSPGQGCSYIKVNNGDNILWEYLGN